MATIVRIRCEGTKPFMPEPMSDETLEMLRKGTRGSSKKPDDPQKEADAKLYRDGAGNITIPVDNFWACLAEAGALVSYKGKRNLSNSEESLLPGVLNVQGDFLKFTDGDGYRVDKRRGRLDNGTAVCIVRPRFDKWGFEATLEIEDKFVDPDKIKELVETAGRFKGMGGHRKKGRFGRFELVEWHVLSNGKSGGPKEDTKKKK